MFFVEVGGIYSSTHNSISVTNVSGTQPLHYSVDIIHTEIKYLEVSFGSNMIWCHL